MYFHTSVPFAANDLALSPDGQILAMVAYSAQANNYVLWMYEVGGQRTSSLGGTQGASYPFWSPDGKVIGFFADGKLKKVDVSGGQVQVLCDAPITVQESERFGLGNTELRRERREQVKLFLRLVAVRERQ